MGLNLGFGLIKNWDRVTESKNYSYGTFHSNLMWETSDNTGENKYEPGELEVSTERSTSYEILELLDLSTRYDSNDAWITNVDWEDLDWDVIKKKGIKKPEIWVFNDFDTEATAIVEQLQSAETMFELLWTAAKYNLVLLCG